MEQYLEIILLGLLIITAVGSAKRRSLREFLITLAYIPYLGALFFLFDSFVQDQITFDSMLLKFSSLGAFYLVYLIIVWYSCKRLDLYVHVTGSFHKKASVAFAGLLGLLRTVYFIFLCLIFFNLHINQPEMIENHPDLIPLNKLAVKTQKYLLKNGYINQTEVLYKQEFVFDSERAGKPMHPIMKKILQSKKYIEIEDQLDESGLKDKIIKSLNY